MLSILQHQTLTMPGVLGLSRLLPSLPLFPMLPPYLWSSLRSFPILWPCLLLFHCKSSFYIIFYIADYRLLTVTLLIRCLVVVRGHPSVSLPPLSSTTLPLFICTPSHYLCTISRDYTYSRRLLHQWPDDFLNVDPPEVDDFRPPSLLRPERHRTSRGRIRTGPRW
jgi:hypothetical protein